MNWSHKHDASIITRSENLLYKKAVLLSEGRRGGVILAPPVDLDFGD